MAYIDETYYTGEYFGADAGDDFDRLASRASDDIDIATQFSVDETDAAAMALVKKACAAQVEWYVQNGDEYNMPMGAGGVSIGQYSEQVNLTQPRKPMELCPRAKAFLEQTGLMFRGSALLRGDSVAECCCE